MFALGGDCESIDDEFKEEVEEESGREDSITPSSLVCGPRGAYSYWSLLLSPLLNLCNGLITVDVRVLNRCFECAAALTDADGALLSLGDALSAVDDSRGSGGSIT